MLNKRGQVFILAAFVIIVIILSLATISNQVRVIEEPKNFYDYSNDVRNEAGYVLDYSINSGFESREQVTDFVRIMAANIRDSDAEANFMFIYGDRSLLTVENYGADVASLRTSDGEKLVEGNLNIESRISLGGSGTAVNSNDYFALDKTGSQANFTNVDQINVTILKNEFSFNIREDIQVIFLTQKEDGDEKYISV